ncbi:hypothetical protein CAPTEDRAFT_199994 [Capitella teleta]|uniref:Enoyl reductase (ER) domain-containing protein n=1 Tax=Capitella teleta TaxID=283909 RepID=R7TEC8_CAPTE|nr:hypothetical protein CAPTEDRAFT_199994 [Capitella teleta]|eukprot:ELT92123.1 hypothetical protein CAPTEDRAFT_199994 [Capitella teleta]
MTTKAVQAQIDVKNDCSTSYALSDQVIPNLQPHEVLLDIRACALTELQTELLCELHKKKKPLPHHSVGHHVSGIVRQTGASVARFHRGDRVAVQLPEVVTFTCASAALADGLRAYTALQYQAHVTAGETVLVLNAASASSLLVQLCHKWGAKVIATCATSSEKDLLLKLQPPPAHIIEVGEKRSNKLLTCVMEETGGLGVSVIIDQGVRQFVSDDDHATVKDSDDAPLKHELLSCLGVGGRWVTSHSHLQLDPPDSWQLHLRRASLCFLSEHTWTLSPSQHGRLQHVLKDLLNQLDNGSLVLNISHTISLSEVTEWMPKVKSVEMGQDRLLTISYVKKTSQNII